MWHARDEGARVEKHGNKNNAHENGEIFFFLHEDKLIALRAAVTYITHSRRRDDILSFFFFIITRRSSPVFS